MRTRSVVSASVVLLLLAFGCSAEESGDDETSQSAESSLTEPAASAEPPGEGQIDASFDVGSYELHLSCLGEASPGSPTIIYLHGLGGDGSDVHEALAPALTDRTRLCTYDRVNVGLSGRWPRRHTGADSVDDLHALLAAADVPPPYVLIGFSFGGLIAAMYTASYPADVAGLLMLDSSLPTDADVDAMIPARARAEVRREQQANAERVDFYATLKVAAPLVERIPDVPTTYMAARPVELPPSWPVQRMRSAIAAKQQRFVDALPQGRLVQVQSSHDIDLDKPQLVLAEVDRMLGT
jgi:pimeloyl-ACP methyl ester carboxylesterase